MSVIVLVYGDKEKNDYMEHIHVMIRDLFFRQNTQTNKFHSLLFGLTDKRNVKIDELKQKHKNTYNYQIQIDGVTQLNFDSFILFEKEVHQSINYNTQKTMDNNNGINDMCIFIKRINFNTEGKKCFDIDQRCACEFRLAHLMMCRHEVNHAISLDQGEYIFDILQKHFGSEC